MPGIAAEFVEARRRVVAIFIGGPIPFQLVETVKRDVEPVTAFVLDDRDLERRLADLDRGDPAIDPDAVIEVNDVVPPLQLPCCCGRGSLPVAARAPQATSPAENLVVGQHPEGAHHEPAVQGADGQRHIKP